MLPGAESILNYRMMKMVRSRHHHAIKSVESQQLPIVRERMWDIVLIRLLFQPIVIDVTKRQQLCTVQFADSLNMKRTDSTQTNNGNTKFHGG